VATALLAALKDESENVRGAAARALAQLARRRRVPNPEVAEAIAALVSPLAWSGEWRDSQIRDDLFSVLAACAPGPALLQG
jgi:hypothetical protein